MLKVWMAAIGAAIALVVAPAAYGWNEDGHKIVALIAWSKMTPEIQSKSAQLIRSHPRFDDHFAGNMPMDISTAPAAVQDEWLFAHAAIWPDQVRSTGNGVTRRDVFDFHRARWHFINLPIYLNDEDRAELDGDLEVNLSRNIPPGNTGASPGRRAMNAVQALKFATVVVNDKDTRDFKKGVYLCWLAHLVGDIHQPMHSAALFTTLRFEGGDQGANKVFVRDERLHSVWDGSILKPRRDASGRFQRPTFADQKTMANTLLQNSANVTAGDAAATKMEFETWLQESFELSDKAGYTAPIRRFVSDHEEVTEDDIPSFDPGDNYFREAERIARRRGVEAGFRLAKQITRILDDDR
jgi:hypothetical protein